MRVRIKGAVYASPNLRPAQATAAQAAGKLQIVPANTPFVGTISPADAIAGITTNVPAGGGSSGGGGSKFNSGVRQAVAGVAAALSRKRMSTTLQIIGDSTGTDKTEWFGVLVQKLQVAYPQFTLLWQKYDHSLDTAGGWMQREVVVQGTGNGGGERGATLTSGQLAYTPSAGITTDFDVRVKVRPTDWKPGGSAVKRAIFSRWGQAGQRSWSFFLDETGKLGFEWSTDGTATATTVLSTVAVPFAAGTSSPAAATVRAFVDINNGTSGNTIQFFTSTDDGVTWTQLGTDVVTAGTMTVFAANAAYTVGARGTTPTDFLDGTFYWMELLASSGTNLWGNVPQLPDFWEQTSTAASVVYVGAPVIFARCSSVSGQNISYFDETSRKMRINAPAGQNVIFLSTGHNESNVQATFWTTYSGWISSVQTRQPGVPIVVVSQNPPAFGTLFTSARQVQQRFQRHQFLMTKVAGLGGGVYTLDVAPAFADPSNPADPFSDAWLLGAALELDGVHPTQATWQANNQAVTDTSGSYKWGDYAFKELFETS